MTPTPKQKYDLFADLETIVYMLRLTDTRSIEAQKANRQACPAKKTMAGLPR